ncbi:hypothetical protein MTO96_033197 [Rhipicephalus appendiculatus]
MLQRNGSLRDGRRSSVVVLRQSHAAGGVPFLHRVVDELFSDTSGGRPSSVLKYELTLFPDRLFPDRLFPDRLFPDRLFPDRLFADRPSPGQALSGRGSFRTGSFRTGFSRAGFSRTVHVNEYALG